MRPRGRTSSRYENLKFLTLGKLAGTCGGTRNRKENAERAVRGVPPQSRKRWGWGFKNPQLLYKVPALRSVFPCLHLVHVLRDPRDLAAAHRREDVLLEDADLGGGRGLRQAAHLLLQARDARVHLAGAIRAGGRENPSL